MFIRSSAFPALENVALWHERDISQSSAVCIAPDACIVMNNIHTNAKQKFE